MLCKRIDTEMGLTLRRGSPTRFPRVGEIPVTSSSTDSFELRALLVLALLEGSLGTSIIVQVGCRVY